MWQHIEISYHDLGEWELEVEQVPLRGWNYGGEMRWWEKGSALILPGVFKASELLLAY